MAGTYAKYTPTGLGGGGSGGGGGTITSVTGTFPILSSGGTAPNISLDDYISATNNFFIGPNALSSITTGRNNAAIGQNALQNATTSGNNLAVGASALNAAVTSAVAGNVALGTNALLSLTSGSNNVAIGDNALQAASTSPDGINGLVAIGSASLFNYLNDTGSPLGGDSGVIGIGFEALTNLTNGDATTVIGFEAGFAYTTGCWGNTHIGSFAGGNTTVGQFNTSVGYNSFASSGSNFLGTNNSALGFEALGSLAGTTADNTALGYQAGNSFSQYTKSVFIGSGADAASNSIVNAIAIGFGAKAPLSNTAQIGNTSLLGLYYSGYEDRTQITTPSNPSSGHDRLYFKSDDNLYSLNSSGVETKITGGSGGTVSSVSVVSTNGFAGTVATPTTTPALTLSTTVTGILNGNGTSVAAAVAANFPTLNQNTTGTAANITATSNTTLTSLPDLTSASTLAAVGTITTGVWNGSVIGTSFLPVGSMSGVVTVYPAAIAGSALVLAPNGTQVSTVGTTTAGIQEALNYASTNFFNVHIAGQNGQSASNFYNLTSTLTIPACHEWSITSDAVTLNFGSSVTTGIQFDSCDGLFLDLKGQIVFAATSGQCLSFNPTNAAPTDGTSIFITSSRFNFGQVVLTGVSGTAVACNFQGVSSVNQTGTLQNQFTFAEINGGNYAFLFNLTNAAFQNNIITCPAIHSQLTGIVSSSSTNVNKSLSVNRWAATYPLTNGTTGISVGSSPFTYTNTELVPKIVTINGGVITALQTGNFASGTFSGGSVGAQNVGGAFYLAPGSAVSITYGTAPSMNFFYT